MATCPNKNLQDWKDLVSQRGESMAYYIWDKYKGNIPNFEYSTEPEKFQKQTQSQEGIIASEKTIRDLAARISDRIGIPYRIISDRTQEFKGKIEGNTAIINLAYATLDTPIHEILGHPIVRAIKNKTYLFELDGVTYGQMDDAGNIGKGKYYKDREEISKEEFERLRPTILYENLLKELEYGRGKEVLDRVKRDYTIKKEGSKLSFSEWMIQNINAAYTSGNTKYDSIYIERYEKDKQTTYYTLEEQQEEAIVELLGMMTAEKLDGVKDGKLISLLKRLLKEMKQFVRSLLNLKEVEIDKLPDNMTIGDLADLLAYSNSKLILPGYEVEYTTPDNQKFKTYAEASNHISQLAKSAEDVDLSDVNINLLQNIIDKKQGFTVTKDGYQKVEYRDGKWFDIRGDNEAEYQISETEVKQLWQNKVGYSYIESFIEKNKEYEQSKEIIEEWKKVNNIQYNPEEIYSRGQEFVSVVGAYSDFDVNLMMQNLLQHIEDNEKAGGEFTISAFTKPVDRKIGHLEGGGGKIKFKIYPQSKDILWAANTDVYSGSVWDASEKVSKDKKSELLGVSYTKYPALYNVDKVQPNLASIIDNLAHHHNELGISLNGTNFRLEYDENIPYQTKKIIDNVNSIIDQKYGKLVKPEIEKSKKETILIDNPLPENERSGVLSYSADIEGGYFLDTIYGFERRGYALGDKIYNSKVMQILKIAYPNSNVTYEPFTNKVLVDGKDIVTYSGLKYETPDKIEKEVIGIQPTQTKDNLKESIEDVRSKLETKDDIYGLKLNYNNGYYFSAFINRDSKNATEIWLAGKIDNQPKHKTVEEAREWEKEFLNEFKTKFKKEYTSQALINTKIAKLKEVAKKYPRSLIRSEVRPIDDSPFGMRISQFEDDELPFQKIPSLTEKSKDLKKPEKIITFTSFEDLEKLPKGKPC